MANACAEALRALLPEVDMPVAARSVQVATHNWHQNPRSSRRYHCITMVRLPDCCIIIDPVAHYAIIVPLVLLRRSGRCTTFGNNVVCGFEGGIEGGIENLVFPTDSYLGVIPRKRAVLVDDVWDWAPTAAITHFPLQNGSGHFVVETCSLHMCFNENSISIEYKSREWLARKENSTLLRRLDGNKNYSISMEHDLVHGVYTVYLTTYADTQEGYVKRVTDALPFMEELCVALGLPKGKLFRITDDMLD
ncbi:hypothetical protein EJ02DRAFT_481849 [Clathrospora elynae]|uniref:Uncharacterized protein n=1 Tax=Clathrospora elynae TaxID=706981 RepID=A0A6A5SWQ0_9PLEO|nr:hypothetical protein EJ02DRAFT_481849 [Clathrospora elynae]